MNVDMIASVIGFLALLGVLFFGCRFIDSVMAEYFSISGICKRYGILFSIAVADN